MSVADNKFVIIDPAACTGCHACELACSLKHFQVCGTEFSSIRIHEFREENLFVPVICQACEDPVCVKLCPMDARKKTETGSLITDENKCIKCRTCLYACPFCAAPVNPDTGRPVNCDLCRDEPLGPWCVRACQTHKALKFELVREEVKAKQRNWAENVKKISIPDGFK